MVTGIVQKIMAKFNKAELIYVNPKWQIVNQQCQSYSSFLVQKSIHRFSDNNAQNAPDTAYNKLSEDKSHEERNGFAMGF